MEEMEDRKIAALGKVIKMEMVGQDLTQQVLADRIGIHRETLSRYLGGKAGYNAPIGVLFRIADELGVSLEELVARSSARL